MASNPIGNRPQRSRRSLTIQSRSNQQEIEAPGAGRQMMEDDVLKPLAAERSAQCPLLGVKRTSLT
jgi:hypothetical protein